MFVDVQSLGTVQLVPEVRYPRHCPPPMSVPKPHVIAYAVCGAGNGENATTIEQMRISAHVRMADMYAYRVLFLNVCIGVFGVHHLIGLTPVVARVALQELAPDSVRVTSRAQVP